MAEDVYRKLQEHLHSHPMGFPATESGVELQLLGKMFEKEEAGIALALTPKPATPDEIAATLGQDAGAMAEKLDRMARRGLIMRVRKGDSVFYNLEPYVVGIYEFQIGRLDKEFIDLHDKFGAGGLGAELYGSQTPFLKVVPAEKNIPSEMIIYPHEKVSEIIDKADKVFISDCICRTKHKMTGEGCDHTVQNCMVFSPYAEYYSENGWPGRFVSKKEALEILDQAEEEGLVHTSQNTASGPWYICNCCACCCAVLKAVNQFKLHNQTARSYYFAEVDEDLCTGCEVCVERCQFLAVSMDNDISKINLDYCMGCGLCVSSCAKEARSMVRKPEDQIVQPPSDLSAMLNQIGEEKGRSLKVPPNM